MLMPQIIPPLYFSVILIKEFVIDTFQLASRKNGKQLPADGQCFLNITVSLIALGNIFLLESIRIFCLDQVNVGESCLTKNSHQLFGLFTTGICGKQLVHGVGMVCSCLAFTDTLILQS